MDLYVVRHAKAYGRDPDRWPDDGDRPLTPEGEREFRGAASGLLRLASPPGALLSSPYRRAWRTAEILAELDGWPAPEASLVLEPTLPPEKAAGELAACAETEAVAIVGHRPGLHELCSYLLTGSAGGAEVNIKKGGALCLRFEGAVEPGAGELRWLLAPAMLRALAGQPDG